MAFFDEGENKYVVRIVYDGPARAGKTSNLRALCDIFSMSRRSEMISPGELAERTTFFDWLQVDSGIVAGAGLRSVFLTVPGQRVLVRRRFALLDMADAVAFVVDATRNSLEEAAQMWAVTRERLAQRPEMDGSVVVQLNKSDIEDCYNEAEVREALGLAPEIRVVQAVATQGIGVRETAVLVMRAASTRVQERLLSGGRKAFEFKEYDAEAMRSELEALDADTPYSPVAMLQNPSHDTMLNTKMPSGRKPVLDADGKVAKGLPPLPNAEVQSGHFWPAEGLSVLRRIENERAVFRKDLNGNPGYGDGSGGTDTMVFQAGKYCLKTSRRRSTRDPEEGRARLLALARSKTMLGELIPDETVISLHGGSEDDYWIWTTTPWLPTLRYLMQTAVVGQERVGLGEALSLYAEAILKSIELAVRSGIVLDVHPSNFVANDNRISYVDDDVALGNMIPTLGYSILRRVEEYATYPDVVQDYVNRVISGLLERVTPEERESFGLHTVIRDTLVRSEAAQNAKQRILDAV